MLKDRERRGLDIVVTVLDECFGRHETVKAEVCSIEERSEKLCRMVVELWILGRATLARGNAFVVVVNWEDIFTW